MVFHVQEQLSMEWVVPSRGKFDCGDYHASLLLVLHGIRRNWSWSQIDILSLDCWPRQPFMCLVSTLRTIYYTILILFLFYCVNVALFIVLKSRLQRQLPWPMTRAFAERDCHGIHKDWLPRLPQGLPWHPGMILCLIISISSGLNLFWPQGFVHCFAKFHDAFFGFRFF